MQVSGTPLTDGRIPPTTGLKLGTTRSAGQRFTTELPVLQTECMIKPDIAAMHSPQSGPIRPARFGPFRSGKCTTQMVTQSESSNDAGAPVAQWVKRWPTDLADRVRFPLE